MARINASTNEKIVSIKAFLGLHESPDGDNKLKLGEAITCKNWRVTENGNLTKRYGTTLKYTLGTNKPVKGMWHGWVNKREITVAACDDKLWLLMDVGEFLTIPQNLGTYNCDNDVSMIGFAEKLWLLNGKMMAVLYYKSNSWHFDNVTSGNYGYSPLVAITVPPEGGGVLLEQINKLNGLRRVWLSTDESSSTYKLPQEGLTSITHVIDLADPDNPLTAGTDYSFSLSDGTITFKSDGSDAPAPKAGPNTYEVEYIFPDNYVNQIKSMRYAELYAGTQDNRMFIYGDGSNMAFYSGLDYDGNPRGDYFPDLNVVDVGDSNTPISAMIRHYGKLLAFKNPVGCYSIEYGVVTLADTSLTPAFYTTPLNKIIGNEANGQVQLVLNAPRTLSAGHLFEWRNGSAYSANISIDERQAKRISDRVFDTLRKMDFSKVHCYDDNLHQEYYIVDDDGNALVHNYFADAWYYYTGVNARVLLEVHGDLYIGTKTGEILLFDKTALGDWTVDTVTAEAPSNLTVTVDGAVFAAAMMDTGTYVFEYKEEDGKWYLGDEPGTAEDLAEVGVTYTGTPVDEDKITVSFTQSKAIDCQWDSGSMDFGAGYMRKYSALLWVSVKAEENNAVTVTAQTDRTLESTEVVVDPDYDDNLIPKVKRCKVKLKKFVYYRLKYLSDTNDTTATVVDTELKVRYTSQAK